MSDYDEQEYYDDQDGDCASEQSYHSDDPSLSSDGDHSDGDHDRRDSDYEQEYQRMQEPDYAPAPPRGGQRQGQYPPFGGYAPRPAYNPPCQPPQSMNGQYFEYSRCSGRRKALLIGINYLNTSAELRGCINDVRNVQRFLVERYGYQPGDMVVLTDDATDQASLPFKDNILRAMGWLVNGAQKDDALFLHYSGHGTQADDVNGDEGDDDDEAICPLDYESAGLIVDDDPIFDSCHSGTVMDLPYIYSTEGTIKEPDYFAGAQDDLLQAGKSAVAGDSGGLFKGIINIAKGAFDAHMADAKVKKNNTSAADVIQWSGCKDDQTSADTQEAGRATGAMSYAFIAALTRNPNQSYRDLLVSIREEMRGKYTQKPQLSACHPIDTDLLFVA